MLNNNPYSFPGCRKEIQEIIAEYKRIPPENLKIRSRKKEIREARQLAIFFINKCSKMSLQDIAYLFSPGINNHSTVLHSIEKVEDDLSNPEYKWHFQQIEKEILKYGYVRKD
jgi:chromosomal replication initiator protein